MNQLLTFSINYVNSMHSLSLKIISNFMESDERMIQTLQFWIVVGSQWPELLNIGVPIPSSIEDTALAPYPTPKNTSALNIYNQD